MKYMMVPEKVKNNIIKELDGINYDLEFSCYTSDLDDDSYLFLVVCSKRNYTDESTKYAFLEYNDSTGSLFWGKYRLNFKRAMEYVGEKILVKN